MKEDEKLTKSKPTSSTNEEPFPKRLKASTLLLDGTVKKKGSPSTFLTWNANGFVSRCLYNAHDMQRLLQETNYPDVLCLQEVRLKAATTSSSVKNRATPLPSEYQLVQQVLESSAVFGDYETFWSLADTRYAGTLTLLHKRLHIPGQDSMAFSTRDAISVLLKRFQVDRTDIRESELGCGGDDDNNNDVVTSPPTKSKNKQTSISSFFAPKAATGKKTTTKAKYSNHHPEGRFQFFCFANCDLMQTYVPNNGTNEDSFQRRRDWDRDIRRVLDIRLQILEKAQQQQRPLLWCGDMNVARDYRDGTHWEERSHNSLTNNCNANNTSTIYEWWRDETQCFAGSQAGKLDPNRSPDDRGIPSFTTNERRRFAEILQLANLSDVWRELHPEDEKAGDTNTTYKFRWDRPCWTWRGHLGKAGNPYASKYQGKGQRLDYFLLSPAQLTPQIVDRCEIMGYGEKRQGHFCGSDHCAVLLRLKTPLGSNS